jgi:pyridoxal phosphate enzyme (YggS family)
VVELIRGLTADRVRANLEAVQGEIAGACARAGRDPAGVAVLAAVKYVAAEELGVLADAGIRLVGENRAQELERKAGLAPELTWDFIGHLQSRKVRQVLPWARLIHSVSTDSVLRELRRHATAPRRILVEVNVSGEAGKGGVPPADLGPFLERCGDAGGVEVAGLMTMPPLARAPEDSRRWFAALAELAATHDLPELSMGTTQDFAVAVEEGATIVRIGTRLYR